MAELRVQFNKLGVGSSYIDSQIIDPVHKQKLEESLSKIFQQRSDIPKDFPFKINFRGEKADLKIGNEEIELSKGPELRRVEDIFRYYQHTGHLPREVMEIKDISQRDAAAKKLVKEMNQACIPGTNGNALAGMRIADDSLSLTRNLIFAFSEFGSKDPIAKHLGYYAGIFWSFFSLRELDDGVIEYRRSKRIGDREGKKRAEARLLSGSVVSTAAFSYLGGKICDTLGFPGISSVLSGVTNGLFGVGALLAMGSSILGGLRCRRFNRRLSEYLDHRFLSKVQSMRGAVQFLKDSMMVTAEERLALIHKIDQKHPDWTSDRKQRLLLQKIADLTETKIKYTKRRTSNRSLQLISSMADRILVKLSDPATQEEGIQEAARLIEAVQQESHAKMNLYIFGFLAALITLVGMVILFSASAGVLPFVLFSVSGAIYLCLTLYTVTGTLLPKNLSE